MVAALQESTSKSVICVIAYTIFFSQFLLILTQLDSSFRHIVRYLLLLYHIFGRRGYTETKCGDPHKQQEESGRQ